MSSPPLGRPLRPRAARAADGFVRGSEPPGPGPVLPAAPFRSFDREIGPSWHGFGPSKAHPSAVVPFSHGDSSDSNHPPAAEHPPRQAITTGLLELRALSRVPSWALARALLSEPRPPATVAPPKRSKLALFGRSAPIPTLIAIGRVFGVPWCFCAEAQAIAMHRD